MIDWSSPRRAAAGMVALTMLALLSACRDDAALVGVRDTTAPTVSITSHSDGTTLTNTSGITVSGTLADDRTISSLTVLQGGADVTSSVSLTYDQTSFSFGLTLGPGDNEIEVQATDESANTGSGTANIISLHIASVSAGQSHTCISTSTGKARCWGRGLNGRTGYDSVANIGDGIGITIIAAGDVPVGASLMEIESSLGGHVCALLNTGAIRCWGGVAVQASWAITPVPTSAMA